MGTLTSKFEGSKMKSISETAPATALDKANDDGGENDSSKAEEETKKQMGDKGNKAEEAGDKEEEEDEVGEPTNAAAVADEDNKFDKAAKRQRLKSGFRVCKPQGTFLWPNNATANSGGADGSTIPATSTSTANDNNNNGKVVVHVEDLFLVPTPPSTSSSSSSAPPLPFPPPPSPLLPSPLSSLAVNRRGPTSPAKPLAERRAVNVTVSTVSTTVPAGSSGEEKALLNLNEAPPPATPATIFCGTASSRPPHLTVTIPPRVSLF